MMPQREASEPRDEQASSAYGGYEGYQADIHQQFETSYQRPLQEERVAKVYVPVHDNKNMLRLVTFAMGLVALIALAVICLVLVRGTGGWVSFCEIGRAHV